MGFQGPLQRSTDSETVGLGTNNLVLTISRWFWCVLECEKHQCSFSLIHSFDHSFIHSFTTSGIALERASRCVGRISKTQLLSLKREYLSQWTPYSSRFCSMPLRGPNRGPQIGAVSTKPSWEKTHEWMRKHPSLEFAVYKYYIWADHTVTGKTPQSIAQAQSFSPALHYPVKSEGKGPLLRTGASPYLKLMTRLWWLLPEARAQSQENEVNNILSRLLLQQSSELTVGSVRHLLCGDVLCLLLSPGDMDKLKWLGTITASLEGGTLSHSRGLAHVLNRGHLAKWKRA